MDDRVLVISLIVCLSSPFLAVFDLFGFDFFADDTIEVLVDSFELFTEESLLELQFFFRQDHLRFALQFIQLTCLFGVVLYHALHKLFWVFEVSGDA